VRRRRVRGSFRIVGLGICKREKMRGWLLSRAWGGGDCPGGLG